MTETTKDTSTNSCLWQSSPLIYSGHWQRRCRCHILLLLHTRICGIPCWCNQNLIDSLTQVVFNGYSKAAWASRIVLCHSSVHQRLHGRINILPVSPNKSAALSTLSSGRHIALVPPSSCLTQVRVGESDHATVGAPACSGRWAAIDDVMLGRAALRDRRDGGKWIEGGSTESRSVSERALELLSICGRRQRGGEA